MSNEETLCTGETTASIYGITKRKQPLPDMFCEDQFVTVQFKYWNEKGSRKSKDNLNKYGLIVFKTTAPQVHNRFTARFPGPPRWAGARRKLLLDFMMLGRITRGRHTDNPCRRHSIWTNQQSTSINPTIFTLDALPATTLPIYPGLGQAQERAGLHTSSGLVHVFKKKTKEFGC